MGWGKKVKDTMSLRELNNKNKRTMKIVKKGYNLKSLFSKNIFLIK